MRFKPFLLDVYEEETGEAYQARADETREGPMVLACKGIINHALRQEEYYATSFIGTVLQQTNNVTDFVIGWNVFADIFSQIVIADLKTSDWEHKPDSETLEFILSAFPLGERMIFSYGKSSLASHWGKHRGLPDEELTNRWQGRITQENRDLADFPSVLMLPVRHLFAKTFGMIDFDDTGLPHMDYGFVPLLKNIIAGRVMDIADPDDPQLDFKGRCPASPWLEPYIAMVVRIFFKAFHQLIEVKQSPNLDESVMEDLVTFALFFTTLEPLMAQARSPKVEAMLSQQDRQITQNLREASDLSRMLGTTGAAVDVLKQGIENGEYQLSPNGRRIRRDQIITKLQNQDHNRLRKETSHTERLVILAVAGVLPLRRDPAPDNSTVAM